jgi:uncharacterized membrane protein
VLALTVTVPFAFTGQAGGIVIPVKVVTWIHTHYHSNTVQSIIQTILGVDPPAASVAGVSFTAKLF